MEDRWGAGVEGVEWARCVRTVGDMRDFGGLLVGHERRKHGGRCRFHLRECQALVAGLGRNTLGMGMRAAMTAAMRNHVRHADLLCEQQDDGEQHTDEPGAQGRRHAISRTA